MPRVSRHDLEICRGPLLGRLETSRVLLRLLPPSRIPSQPAQLPHLQFWAVKSTDEFGIAPATTCAVTVLAPRPSSECCYALATARGRRRGWWWLRVAVARPLGERHWCEPDDSRTRSLRQSWRKEVATNGRSGSAVRGGAGTKVHADHGISRSGNELMRFCVSTARRDHERFGPGLPELRAADPRACWRKARTVHEW